MFNSTILDVAIGVIFGFLAVSLVTSTIVEAANSLLQTRSTSLLGGIKDLVNDPQFNGLAKALYEHAMINPRGSKNEPLSNKPAYIDKAQFASALLDITGLSATAAANPPGPAALAEFQKALQVNLQDPQIKQMMDGIVQRTGGDIERVRCELAAWFDNAMDRIGGAFKRRTQLASFFIALLVAVAFNIDTLHLARIVWEQPDVMKTWQVPATLPDAQSALDQILPLGWQAGHFLDLPMASIPQSVAGWLLTAFATLFGAPFWFDVLQSFVRLKGSGPSPEEKLNGRAAAA